MSNTGVRLKTGMIVHDIWDDKEYKIFEISKLDWIDGAKRELCCTSMTATGEIQFGMATDFYIPGELERNESKLIYRVAFKRLDDQDTGLHTFYGTRQLLKWVVSALLEKFIVLNNKGTYTMNIEKEVMKSGRKE